MAGYTEGQTLYDPQGGRAITLQRGSDGVLKWSDPVPIPAQQAGGTGKIPPSDGSNTPVMEDLAKTAAPAFERGVMSGVTAIPTLASGAAQLASKGSEYLPTGVGSKVKSGAEATSNFLKPFTYPDVQGRVEATYNQQHPGSPLYYPQTGPGQFLEAGIQGGVAAAATPLSMIKALTGPLTKTGGRLATGVGAGLGSEAAGQTAEAADLGPYVSGAARVGGAYLGGKEAAERPRKMVTPNPAISPAHLEMSRLLEKQPGDVTTAGQFSGNPKFLQKDANLAPYAPAPYNNLGVTQPKADTSSLLGTAGVPPAVAAKGASRPIIKTAKDEIGDRLDALGTTTQSKYDPEFHQSLKDITDEYYRIKNTSPNPVTPSPIDNRIAQIYRSGPKSTRAGLNGDEYSQLRSDISKEASGYSKTDPVTGGQLAKIRDALDANMARTGGPNAGGWQQNFDQWESAKALEKATKQRPPAAGVLDPNAVSNASRNPDSQIAQLARAQATVHKPLPAPAPPGGTIPAMAGALISHLTGGSPAEGSIAGHISGPDLQKSLFRNPLTAGIHFSDWNQNRLKNQSWQPGPGSTMDPATVARLLALQKTESTPPQEQ